MRIVVVEFPDHVSARLAVRAIRPVLASTGATWWLDRRGERWLIGGTVPRELEDFVAETVSALGGWEVPSSADAVRDRDRVGRP